MNTLFALALAWLSPPAHGETAALALRLGISPPVLAASGVSAQGAARVLQGIRDASTARSAFASAQSALDDAINSLAEVQNEFDATANPELIEQRTTLESAVLAARTEMQTARADLVVMALSGESTEARQRVVTVMTNQHAKLPVEFKVLPLAPQQIEELAVALVAAARNDRGDDADSDAGDVVREYRTHSDVIAAEVGLSNNLQLIKDVFARTE